MRHRGINGCLRVKELWKDKQRNRALEGGAEAKALIGWELSLENKGAEGEKKNGGGEAKGGQRMKLLGLEEWG